MATNIEILKFNLQEKQYPYFDDDDLQMLLDTNDNDVKKASYEGCLLKANADDGLTLSNIKLSSNRDYWLTLAKQYETGSYSTSMRRADEI
ncbi:MULTISPECIES: hypothetical protein [Clostridium]|uniref:hypothetical protein n=1 Tax=Clostridium TaxID=1485 RepID=UPI000824CE0A|nr:MULTISPECIES: hypothetical protein [Clostridium]PJI07047.1 hypothetical protein CUB90_03840 [Clostridium sp. CT7]